MACCTLAYADRVVATLRKPEALNVHPRAAARHVSRCHEPLEIKAAFVKSKESFGRVDVVFHDAGYAIAGKAEAVPDELARAPFDVIFWGGGGA